MGILVATAVRIVGRAQSATEVAWCKHDETGGAFLGLLCALLLQGTSQNTSGCFTALSPFLEVPYSFRSCRNAKGVSV